MSLKGPNNGDVQKIHAEINQIVNQRFLVITIAVAIFGVVGTWLIPKNTPSTPNDESVLLALTVLGSILLTSLLFMLFIVSHCLTRMLRIYTTYLIVTNKSDWEQDWKRYREKKYFGYTKTLTIFFLFLIGLSTFIPVIFSIFGAVEFKLSLVSLVGIKLGVVYLFFVAAMGLGGRLDNEKKAKKKWEDLCREK